MNRCIVLSLVTNGALYYPYLQEPKANANKNRGARKKEQAMAHIPGVQIFRPGETALSLAEQAVTTPEMYQIVAPSLL